MQPSPSQIFIFNNLRILTRFTETVDLCIYEPRKKLYVTKLIPPEDLGYYETIAQIEHPNLARIEFIIQNGNEYRAVREYISGDCLADLIGGGRTYSEERASQIVYEICSGLSALHSRSIVHRDVNPNNIIITTDGTAKIIDYGIARSYKESRSSDTSNMGTPGYAAPEQYGFSQSNGRTDIYAIGVLLNVLICGKRPNEQLAPGKAARIVRKCTEIDYRNRYANMLELMRDIEKRIGVKKSIPEKELTDSLVDKIMGNIPGIRTGNIFFCIIAVLWYSLAVFLIFRSYVILKPSVQSYILNTLFVIMTFIFPTFCFHNVLDIWNLLPPLKRTSKKGQRAFFYSLGVLSAITGLTLLGFFAGSG